MKPCPQLLWHHLPVTVAVNESQEMDEDEGIHSHDGSDLSDNTSEDSDDSGLNGARPVPQETSGKDGKDALAVKVAEGDFVCIFCDCRSFSKGKRLQQAPQSPFGQCILP